MDGGSQRYLRESTQGGSPIYAISICVHRAKGAKSAPRTDDHLAEWTQRVKTQKAWDVNSLKGQQTEIVVSLFVANGEINGSDTPSSNCVRVDSG